MIPTIPATTITVPTALVEAARSAMDGATARPWTYDDCVAPDWAYGIVRQNGHAILAQPGRRDDAYAIVCAVALADAILAAPPAPAQPDLDAIEAEVRDATPGPLEWTPGYNNGGCPTSFLKIPGHNQGAEVEMMAGDVAAIVAAVNAVPGLVAEVRRLRAATEAMRAWGEARAALRGAFSGTERWAAGVAKDRTRDAAADAADALVAQGCPVADPTAPADAGDEAMVRAYDEACNAMDTFNAAVPDERMGDTIAHAHSLSEVVAQARSALLSRLASLRADVAGYRGAMELDAERLQRVADAIGATDYCDSVGPILAAVDALRARAERAEALTAATMKGAEDVARAGAQAARDRDAARSALAECQKSLAASGRMVDTWHSRAEMHRQAADAARASLSRATERGDAMREAIRTLYVAWGAVQTADALAVMADAVRAWDARDAAGGEVERG